MALTLGDVWQLQSAGRAPVIAQGSSVPASTALAGHGACQLNGNSILMAGYDQDSGHCGRRTRSAYTLPADLTRARGGDAVVGRWPVDGAQD